MRRGWGGVGIEDLIVIRLCRVEKYTIIDCADDEWKYHFHCQLIYVFVFALK